MSLPAAALNAGRNISRFEQQSAPVDIARAPMFTWPALLLSSLAFGALHGAWVAGTLAGLAYGLVRYRSQHIGAAMLAHATTNGLLTGYVLVTGHWSVW